MVLLILLLITAILQSLWIIKLFRQGYVSNEHLSHHSICKIIAQFDLGDFEGVCYGFTLNWASENALGNEELFNSKINQMRLHQHDIKPTLERIKVKRLNTGHLTNDELLIEALPDLLTRICRAQEPKWYQQYYKKLLRQSDVNDILKTLNYGFIGPQHIYFRTHTLEQDTLLAFLKELKRHIVPEVSIVISSMDHAIGIKRVNGKWRLIDTNYLFINKTPYQELSSKQMVGSLAALAKDDTPFSKRMIFNIDLISLAPYPHLTRALSNAFPFYRHMNNNDKMYYFAMAASQGDVVTVKQCLMAGWSIYSNHPASEHPPILTAISSGHSTIVYLMLKERPEKVNRIFPKLGHTLLHQACKYGGTNVVASVLKIPGIEINVRDREGKTPVMWASQLTEVNNDKALFKLLFKKGASLALKDHDGIDALGHATRSQHKIAEQMINAQLQKNYKYSPTLFRPLADKVANNIRQRTYVSLP